MQFAAHDPIVEHVEAGQDVVIEAGPASARLDRLAAGFEDRFNVVRLTAPPGGLSLSALIAQLSGRDRLDEQDDGALEIGFRRLCGTDAPDRRTVLLLDATQGLQRAVLRYLQQVGRNAPGLQFVIASFPALATLLEAPDMARLRARLALAVAAEPVAEAAPRPALLVSPRAGLPIVSAAGLPAVSADDWADKTRRRPARTRPARSRRVALMWATSALAVVASTALGAWLSQGHVAGRAGMTAAAGAPVTVAAIVPAAVDPAERRVEPGLVPMPASVGSPPLAAKVAPAQAARPPTVGADAVGVAAPGPVPLPALAKLVAPETVAAGEPPAAVPVKPETVSFASVEERLASMTAHSRASETRRPAPPVHARSMGRLRAPAGAPGSASRFAEEDRPLPNYEVEDLPPEAPLPALRRPRGRVAGEPASANYDFTDREPGRTYGDPDPGGARYEPPGDGAYIGTFSTGPYGARVFRYGP